MSARSRILSLLPSVADYQGVRRTWKGDVLAGLTVGIVALPLALAFGISSGAGAEAGLVTAIVAGIVAGICGGSNVQVSGPTGAMVVVLGPIVAAHGVGAVATVSVMAGIIVVAGGVLRLGRAVSFIPWPVIEGFTLGIAVIIFLQQVPAAIGSKAGSSSNAVLAAIGSFGSASWPSSLWDLTAVAAVAAMMVFAPRISRLVPGSILGIIAVTVIASVAELPMMRIGLLPSTLPTPALPVWDWAMLAGLAGPAFTVAGLAAIESLLSARVAASISDTGPYDPDRELVGQGLASIASGFFGGMPATGAIARTAVNIRSGGRTRLATMVHAVVLIVIVYAATQAVSKIPVAALAGVLMVTAVRMVSRATVRGVLRSSKADAIIFVVTAIITVSVDLIVAVGIGIAVAAFFALRTLATSGGVHREALPAPAQEHDERIALFRLDGALFFGTADRILERITQIDAVDVVIIRMSQLQSLDATGARVITDIVNTLENRGITVLIKGIQSRHERITTQTGVTSSLRHPKHLFTELPAAIAHARTHIARN